MQFCLWCKIYKKRIGLESAIYGTNHWEAGNMSREYEKGMFFSLSLI